MVTTKERLGIGLFRGSKAIIAMRDGAAAVDAFLRRRVQGGMRDESMSARVAAPKVADVTVRL